MSKEQGQKIGVKFTQTLIGDISGLTPNPVGGYHNVSHRPSALSTLNLYSSSYPVSNMIDGDVGTYWRGTTAVNWILAQFAEAFVMKTFKLYMGSYYVATFTISGSNDGTNFTQIGGTYTGASSTTAQWYEYAITNETAYLYYKIDTLTAYSTSRIYVYELSFLSYDPIGNEQAFTISGLQYDCEPEGAASTVTYTVKSVVAHPTEPKSILLTLVDTDNGFRNVAGDLTVAYNSTLGALSGVGGPVASFSTTFSPEDLVRKPDINAPVHIGCIFSGTTNLLRIYYSSYQDDQLCNVHIANASGSGALTNVNDL